MANLWYCTFPEVRRVFFLRPTFPRERAGPEWHVRLLGTARKFWRELPELIASW